MSQSSIYAKALYELAAEQNCEQEVYDAVLSLQDCLLEVPSYVGVISSPVIDKMERINLLREVFQTTNIILQNTVYLLSDKNESHLLDNLLNDFISLYHDANNITKVQVFSAIPVSEDLLDRLKAALCESSGKEILLKNYIDPECIGGIRLQMDGRQYDGSIKGQIDEIGRFLTQELKD